MKKRLTAIITVFCLLATLLGGMILPAQQRRNPQYAGFCCMPGRPHFFDRALGRPGGIIGTGRCRPNHERLYLFAGGRYYFGRGVAPNWLEPTVCSPMPRIFIPLPILLEELMTVKVTPSLIWWLTCPKQTVWVCLAAAIRGYF